MFRKPLAKFTTVCLWSQLLLAFHIDAAVVPVTDIGNDPLTAGTLPYALLNANAGDTIDCTGIAGLTIT